jgi:uncharacterized integral membrane protein
MRAFLAIMVVLLILLLIFAVQNPGSTQVKFLTVASTVSLLLIILVSAVVGLLLGLAVMLPGNLRRSSHVRKLESENEGLRRQSDELIAGIAKNRPQPEDRAGRPEPEDHSQGSTSDKTAQGA